jgi:hypothetical protein
MAEKEYISIDAAYDIGTLTDWYISSVSQDDAPVWTDEHLEELLNDFYVIPKDTPTVDAAPVKHGHWSHLGGDEWCCSNCGQIVTTEGSWERPWQKFCPNCGARMDGDADANGNDNKTPET